MGVGCIDRQTCIDPGWPHRLGWICCIFECRTRIVSGSDDKSVRVWDASTGRHVLTLDGHTNWVRSVAFSSDGTRIVSGSEDNSVRVWDASTGRHVLTLDGHTRWVGSVAFSSDGTHIVSGSGDKSVRVWDASTGRPVLTLDGHTDWVGSVAFSSDGTRIVSGSGDNTVRTWNAHTANTTTLHHDVGLINSSNTALHRSHWMYTHDNWIISTLHRERLMWVSQDIKTSLHTPETLLVISRRGSATVDFTRSKIGPEWVLCYTPSNH